MQNPFKSKETVTNVNQQIDDVLARMLNEEPDSAQYRKLLVHLERLHAIKAEQRPPRLSRDTMLLAAVGLVQVVIIVGYEHAHVATSKTMNQYFRPNATF